MRVRRDAYEARVYQAWADYWACDPAFFARPGTSLRPHTVQHSSPGVHVWTIQRRVFIEYDPGRAGQLGQIIEQIPGSVMVTADLLARHWRRQEIDAISYGLIFHLYPADLPERHLPGGFALRRLTHSDDEQVRQLEEAVSVEEVSEAYVSVEHEMACGVFQLRGQGETPVLVSAASAYERAGFVDPGVLTHPDFRGRGFGSAAVHALCQWAIRQERIMQYRCNRENAASMGLARRLGFTQYVVQDSIWLK